VPAQEPAHSAHGHHQRERAAPSTGCCGRAHPPLHRRAGEYARTRARLDARARTQRAWAEKGVRNARRKATDNDTNVKATRAESSEKQAAKARQTDRMIERLEVVAEPRKEWELRMEIAAAPRCGAVVAAARGAVVRRAEYTPGPIDLQIGWAQRVAITGANGAGKSTLLAALLGQLPLDDDTALRSSMTSTVPVAEAASEHRPTGRIPAAVARSRFSSSPTRPIRADGSSAEGVYGHRSQYSDRPEKNGLTFLGRYSPSHAQCHPRSS
jgi:ATPase subunit of ABC transporter with duplicated ATPase domains